MRTNLFNIVLSVTFLTLGLTKMHSQELPKRNDSIPAVQQTLILDTLPKPLNLPVADTLKPKKAFLDGIVKRKALDYERISQKKKELTLYNQAELYYQDIELKSGIIVMNYEKKEVYAGRIKDSTGTLTQRPIFKQGSNVVEPDSIRFNYETKKVLIWNSRSQQGELNIKSEIAKKENDSVYFLWRTKFTTSEDVDDPEYYFLARKAKFVPGKKVVVGLTNMYIADVPTPIGLPFAFFPMTDTAQSGVIIPSFQDTSTQGYSLQNGGYYFALSDNVDLTMTGDYYTNGTYATRFESAYAKRYRFRGNVNFRFENIITSERGFPDYAKRKEYNIQWSHSQDGKSNPNSRFSASVNLGSSTYFTNSLNQINVGARLNNTLQSSVSYSKTFNTIPQVNSTISATHTQNTQSGSISMTLPTFTTSVDRIFPFASADRPKKGVIENINLQYNVIGENKFETNDSLFFKPEMFKAARNGMRHTIPVNTNFKFLKYFSVPLNVNYNEVWYTKTISKRFDPIQDKVITREIGGFDAYRTYSFSTGVGTTIYGTFDFGKDKKIQSIRHVVKPNITYSYTPSFEKYYDTYATDASGNMQTEYSRFDQGIYGSPQKSMSNILGFTLNNTFEAKVTDRDTTKTEPKKIMLLNSLNFFTSYDISKDSLNWAPLRVTGGTVLFKEKMNINFGATLDPYAINNAGRQINTFNINNGGSLFRLTSANMTINYSLTSKGSEKSNSNSEQGKRNGGREDDLFGRSTELGDRRQSQFGDEDDEDSGPMEFYNTKTPWDLTIAYALTYGNSMRQNEITGNSLMVSGNLELAPRWKVGASTGYDFANHGVTFTQLRFERDLLSWRMDFTWVPIGTYTSWGFFIGIKSGMLSDIKWEKRRAPDRTLR